MAYIDYDTKDFTFDDIVPLTYKMLSVLFNYKRTVEDFRKCGPSGHNPYGFSHISSCVGNTAGFFQHGGKKCDDSSAPVKCGDGSCQPDYISCLKVLSVTELNKQASIHRDAHERQAREDSAYTQLLTNKEWEFDSKGLRIPSNMNLHGSTVSQSDRRSWR